MKKQKKTFKQKLLVSEASKLELESKSLTFWARSMYMIRWCCKPHKCMQALLEAG